MSLSAPPMVAVLGCGYWGKNLVRVASELGSLAAICDQDAEIADHLSGEYGVVNQTLDQVMTSSAISAICIATPAVSHYEHALRALHSGKDVFVEKPLALRRQQAEELKLLAESSGRILMVGHLMRYHPCFRRLEGMVSDGTVGDVRYAYSTRLNLGRFRREENILWSFAPHDLSMLIALMQSRPSEVMAIGSSHRATGIADVTTTHLSFPGGRRGHVFVSWLHPFKEQRLVVIGEKAMAVFDDGRAWDTKLVLYQHGVGWLDREDHQPSKAEVERVSVEPAEPLLLEIKHFLSCISDRATPLTDASEGCEVLDVLERAERSMSTGESC